jgi:hypothetical protein
MIATFCTSSDEWSPLRLGKKKVPKKQHWSRDTKLVTRVDVVDRSLTHWPVAQIWTNDLFSVLFAVSRVKLSMFWPWICCFFYFEFARKKRSVDSSFMTGLVAERIQLYYLSRLLALSPRDQLLHFPGSVLHGRDIVINPETDQSLVSLHSRVISQSSQYRNISGITEGSSTCTGFTILC